MKKLLLAILAAVALCAPAYADFDAYTSTNIIINQTGVRLHTGRGILHTVVVGQVGVGSGLDLWDGATTSIFLRKIGSVDTSTGGVRMSTYDIYIASGLVITTTGASPANLTITYKKQQ